MPVFSHGGRLGDVVWALPCIRALGGGVLLLRTGIATDERQHPNPKDRLTREWAEQLIPLLACQPYLSGVRIWDGEPVDYDLDLFRDVEDLDIRYGHIGRYYCKVYPCRPDFDTPWLTVDPDERFRGLILVNLTRRYRIPLDYSFLRGVRGVNFVGLQSEYMGCRRQLGPVPWLRCKDHLDLARIVAACRIFVGNQSFAYSVACGLGVPRVLEVSPHCPNNPGPRLATCQQELEEFVMQLLT